VKDFEIVYELSWKALKEALATQGLEAFAPKDAFSKAFQAKIIRNEDAWLQMLEDRNRTVHVYDEKFAREMCQRISEKYLPEFQKLDEYLRALI